MRIIKFETQNPYSRDQFKIEFSLGNWSLSQDIRKNELIKIRDDINSILGLTEISEIFNVSIPESEEIQKFRSNKNECKECEYYNKLCDKCVLICQSPLERDLMIELKKNNIETTLQLRINKDGSTSQFPEPIDKNKILTIPDFYIESKGKRYAIYTDGYTYHGKTEYQFSRDRSIDREIQLLGYKVLRYPGNDVRNNINKIIDQIKQAIQSE